MARKTVNCVNTYTACQRGKLVIGDHASSRRASRRFSARYTAAKVDGVITYSIDADHEFEDYSEPKVLTGRGHTGRVGVVHGRNGRVHDTLTARA